MGFQKGLAAPISSKFTTFFAFYLLIPIIFQAIEVDLSHDVPELSSVKIGKILMSGLLLEQSMLSLVFASPGAQPGTINRQGNGTRQWRTKLYKIQNGWGCCTLKLNFMRFRFSFEHPNLKDSLI